MGVIGVLRKIDGEGGRKAKSATYPCKCGKYLINSAVAPQRDKREREFYKDAALDVRIWPLQVLWDSGVIRRNYLMIMREALCIFSLFASGCRRGAVCLQEANKRRTWIQFPGTLPC